MNNTEKYVFFEVFDYGETNGLYFCKIIEDDDSGWFKTLEYTTYKNGNTEDLVLPEEVIWVTDKNLSVSNLMQLICDRVFV